MAPPTDRSVPTSPAGTPQLSPEATKFLAELEARTPSGPALGRGRVLLAIDATASRQQTWDQACAIQAEMFEATAALGGLEISLAFYRGFNECKASRWVTTAADLHQIMRNVGCIGGHTQIRRLLEHAVRTTKEQKVAAVIFVGDACEEKVDDVCAPAGELGRLGTPVFVFQEERDTTATSVFRQIAALSGGVHLAFDLSSIDRLKELLGAVAVYASGGHEALLTYGKQKGGAVLQLTTQLRR